MTKTRLKMFSGSWRANYKRGSDACKAAFRFPVYLELIASQTVCANAMETWDEKHGINELESRVYGKDINPLIRGMNVEHTSDGIVHGMIMTPRRDPLAEELRALHKKRDRYLDDLQKRLCAERRPTYLDGCAVHCDCYKAKAAEEWFAVRDHEPTCRLVQPNFL